MVMSINAKLLKIQSELKVPKSQYNSFGKYNFRNCEDILEAVKPLCANYNVTIVLSDEIVMIGDRYYIKATAKLEDTEDADFMYTTAYAREEAEKKGMDGSQVTGAASSYARKYALSGLFAIDDTKDSDTTNTGDKPNGEAKGNNPSAASGGTPPDRGGNERSGGTPDRGGNTGGLRPLSDLNRPPQDMKFRCADCGAELKPYTGADGKVVSIRKHAEGSKAKYGKVLCINCIMENQVME